MKFVKHILVTSVLLGFGTVAAPSWADWAESANMAVIRPNPNSLAVQAQNPPSFTWAKYVGTGVTSYTLEIMKNGALYATYTTNRNFYLPSRQLPAGTYTWRVRPNTVATWSTPRIFVIGATSTVFEVPETAELKTRVLAKAHPRQLDSSFKMTRDWTADMVTKRGPALTKLTSDVTTQITTVELPNDSQWPVTSSTPSAARTAYINQISISVGKNVRQLESAALMWRLTNESKYLTEALRRGDALAALNPNGMTSFANHDVAARQIMLSLVKSLDLLDGDIDTTRRAAWTNTIKTRVAPMYNDLIANNYRLDELPFDSHGQTAMLYLSTIAVLTLGDFPEAQNWFDAAVRAYINSISPWSGPEGGFGNGGAYAMYTVDTYVQMWPVLNRALGIDLFRKPWSVGFSNMVAEFMPPGSPGMVFGDQHEEGLYTAQLKAFMSRFATPAAAWYVKNTSGEETALTLLQAPYPMPSDTQTTVAPPPNAMVLPSTGWVAMHSALADRARTSVYFKSSPFGSYNHSHGDQNGLVINSGGRRLLLEAGYQDYYYSPLGTSWYRQTKSHNAITYNDGIGQVTTDNADNLRRNGKITAFSTTAALDYAEGDATPAYKGALSQATRKVWYMRNEDTVVVLDKLAAPTALKFEWNMHAQGAFVVESPTKLKMTNVDRSLCITSLSTDGTAYKPLTGPTNPRWTEYHGAFVKPAAATTAEFLVVLDVNCKRPVVTLTNTTTGRTLKVGNTSISLPR